MVVVKSSINKKSMTKVVILSICSLFLLTFPAQAGIMDLFTELSPEDVGSKPRIKPHLHASNGFISNANIGDSQADPAWQARVAPGIRISLPLGERLYTEVDYTYAFSTTQGRKTNANINSHDIRTLARYEITDRTQAGISNVLQFSEVPGLAGNTFMLETATGELNHRLGERLSATSTYTFQYFKDRAVAPGRLRSEFADHKVSGNFDYDLADNIKLSPIFGWSTRSFKHRDDKDYWQIEPRMAVVIKVGPNTSVRGNVGWSHRNYEIGGVQNEIVYGAGFNYQLSNRFVWKLDYQKSMEDTFDTSFVFRDDANAVVLDNLDRRFRVVKSHRITTSADYHFNEKNSFGLYGDFQFINGDGLDNVESGADNDEKQMEIGARYRYRLNKFMNLDFGYSIGRRFTTEASAGREGYTYHKVTGGVNIAV